MMSYSHFNAQTLQEDELRSDMVKGMDITAPIATVMWLNPTFTASTLSLLCWAFTWNLAKEVHTFMV